MLSNIAAHCSPFDPCCYNLPSILLLCRTGAMPAVECVDRSAMLYIITVTCCPLDLPFIGLVFPAGLAPLHLHRLPRESQQCCKHTCSDMFAF
jgi:hypothetical protein